MVKENNPILPFFPIDENKNRERWIMAVREKDVKFTITPSVAVLDTPSQQCLFAVVVVF